jgi:hypothetical protein
MFNKREEADSHVKNKTFTVKVEDDEKPIWLYCPQNNPKSHCASGMVAVINPPQYSQNTLDAFRLAAAATTGNATAPSTGPLGGQITTPSGAPNAPGAPAPSGSAFPGSGSSLVVNGGLGLVSLFAALML